MILAIRKLRPPHLNKRCTACNVNIEDAEDPFLNAYPFASLSQGYWIQRMQQYSTKSNQRCCISRCKICRQQCVLPCIAHFWYPSLHKWFGAYEIPRRNLIRSHFDKMARFQFSAITYDCTCIDPGSYGHVNPSNPGMIVLCGRFWSAPAVGADSKAGSLVALVSEFTVNGGTQGFATGQLKCKQLASNNPERAVSNADSHQYFAVNSPPSAVVLFLPFFFLSFFFNKSSQFSFCSDTTILATFNFKKKRYSPLTPNSTFQVFVGYGQNRV